LIVGENDAEGLVKVPIESFCGWVALGMSERALGFAYPHVGVGDLHRQWNEAGFVVGVDTQWEAGVTEDVREEVLSDVLGFLGSEWYCKRITREAIDHHQKPFVAMLSLRQLAVQDGLGQACMAGLRRFAASAIETSANSSSNEFVHTGPVEVVT
jgi:hypothetical protein